MKLSPVKMHYANYPDIYQVDVNRLLLTHRPNRWKSSGVAALLLCTLSATLLTGCQTPTDQSSTRKMNMAPIFDGTVNSVGKLPIVSKLTFHQQKPDIVLLGNYPGPGQNMPLTEDAALLIIENEHRNKGITSAVSKKIANLVSDGTPTTWAFDLDIDGAKEPVYAEFIPTNGMETETELSQRLALKLSHNSKEAATQLRDKLCQVEDASTGVVFYANVDDNAEQNLINQVDEFVTWLKTSGLI